MSIFDTLEADSRQIDNNWLTTDFKGYFTNYPYPTQYKQAWLIKRVLELGGSSAGKTISKKENEIFLLNQTISGLQQQISNLDSEKKKKDSRILDLIKQQESERNFWIKRANEQISDTRTFYLNSIHAIPNNEAKLIKENTDLKDANNKLIANRQAWEKDKTSLNLLQKDNVKLNSVIASLQKTNKEFRTELLKTFGDLDHLEDDLSKERVDRLHAQQELREARNKLNAIYKQPASALGISGDITGDDLKNYATNTLNQLEKIWDEIDLIAHYPGTNPAVEKAKKVSKNFSLWLNGYKNEWGDVLETLTGYKPGERERERESKARKLNSDIKND